MGELATLLSAIATPLHHAARLGDLSTVRKLVKNGEYYVNARDDQNNTPLDVAALCGKEEVALCLLNEFSCDPNGALHNACKGGSVNLVQTLIRDFNPDVNARDDQNNTPLDVAALYGKEEVALSLLNEFSCDPNGALHNACKGGSVNLVRTLIRDFNPDVNARDNENYTPLVVAVSNGKAEVALTLINDFGCDPNVSGIQTLIQEHKVGVNTRDDHNNTHNTQATFDQELDKAMVDGIVDFTGIDSVLVGVGGAGKTHVLHMITNQSVPKVRKSTPCTRPPVRMMISVDSGTMEMVGGEEYFGIIVDTAKAVGSSTSRPDDVGPSIPLPSHPSQTVRQRKTHLPEYMHKLEKEMLQHLSKKRGGEPKLLYKTRWYRLTDSGGQPQFLEVISIFIHNISVGIIVIKLNERLDCFPMMEFYKDDNPEVEPYKSCYSQDQVVRHFMTALTSQAEKGKHVKFLFIGTHNDCIGECDESIEEKNAKLREIVHSFNMEANVIYNGLNPIFPINAKTPGDDDWELIEQVRQRLVGCADVPPIPIPLRWFMMDLALQRFVLEAKQAVLTESKCWELVANYHFDESGFKAGLKYLHQIKHILYYEEKRLVIADTHADHPEQAV